jgi:hypothetical protein
MNTLGRGKNRTPSARSSAPSARSSAATQSSNTWAEVTKGSASIKVSPITDEEWEWTISNYPTINFSYLRIEYNKLRQKKNDLSWAEVINDVVYNNLEYGHLANLSMDQFALKLKSRTLHIP